MPTIYTTPCGIQYMQLNKNSFSTVTLPLERVDVHAEIVDGAWKACMWRHYHFNGPHSLSYSDRDADLLAGFADAYLSGTLCLPGSSARSSVRVRHTCRGWKDYYWGCQRKGSCAPGA